MFSSEEASYQNDVRYLIDSINNKGIYLDQEDMKYTEHSMTGEYYKKYLLRKIEEI